MSLAELEASEGPFQAVVVTAGAAIGNIVEVGPLPLQLCQVRLLILINKCLWGVTWRAMCCNHIQSAGERRGEQER